MEDGGHRNYAKVRGYMNIFMRMSLASFADVINYIFFFRGIVRMTKLYALFIIQNMDKISRITREDRFVTNMPIMKPCWPPSFFVLFFFFFFFQMTSTELLVSGTARH